MPLAGAAALAALLKECAIPSGALPPVGALASAMVAANAAQCCASRLPCPTLAVAAMAVSGCIHAAILIISRNLLQLLTTNDSPTCFSFLRPNA